MVRSRTRRRVQSFQLAREELSTVSRVKLCRQSSAISMKSTFTQLFVVPSTNGSVYVAANTWLRMDGYTTSGYLYLHTHFLFLPLSPARGATALRPNEGWG